MHDENVQTEVTTFEIKYFQEIVKSIIDGSSTFEGKTKFSQEKYLKKKKIRHMFLFTIEKPTKIGRAHV